MARRALHALSSVLIVSGVLLLADAALTVLWQEPVSALYARLEQDRLGGELDRLRDEGLPPAERRLLSKLPSPDKRLAFAARAYARRVQNGDAIGRISADSIGLDTVVVKGTGSDDLRKGPGHYPGTALPGLPGTVAVAGHRTTYGAPFRHLDDLDRGERVVMEMPYGKFTYEVESRRIVKPSATWVIKRVKHDQLVLTACHPLYSAAERIVIFARLVRSEPSAQLV
jgi:sortase A